MVDENATTEREAGAGDTIDSERPVTPPTLELDRYALGAVLGRGGMGEVIAAIDRHIEREVAIKRMRAPSPSPDELRRFEREARVQAQLDHPAIVPVHELGVDSAGRPFFTMKRLAGTTLATRLRDDGPIQPLLRALVDVCFAAAHAHDRRIVHRDIKPTNIMLGNYNEVYVLDWGVARVLDTARSSQLKIVADVAPEHTATGALLGTPGYMAPEQTRGADVGPAADVYALGAILFEILAGEPLHPHGTAALASTLDRPTDSPARRRPDRNVPVELDTVCREALAEDPAARPTAGVLAERIQRYLDGDRDHEQRRALAIYQLGLAREALDSGDPTRRRFAAQSAARALALDPQSVEAQRLVARVVLVPPPTLPPELAAALDDQEAGIERVRSRRAAVAYLWIMAWAVTLPFVTVRSWPIVIATIAWALMMVVRALFNARHGRQPIAFALFGNTVLALLFSQVSSSFVFMPFVVGGQTIALAQHRGLRGRRWVLALWAAGTLLLPILLELAGVLPRTWRISDVGELVTWSNALVSTSSFGIAALIAGQTLLGMVLASFSIEIAKARTTAQTAAFVQAWHLRQMLPRGTSQLP